MKVGVAFQIPLKYSFLEMFDTGMKDEGKQLGGNQRAQRVTQKIERIRRVSCSKHVRVQPKM